MKLKNIFMLIPAIVFAMSCNNTEEPTPVNPLDDLTKVYTEDIQDGLYTLNVYMNEDPFVGFNNVFVEVKQKGSNTIVTDLELEFAPLMTMLMDMGTMQHACPMEQPQFNTEMNAYQGALVFIMPTTDSGSWELKISYRSMAMEGSVSIPLTVMEKEESQLISFVSTSNQKKYFITLIEPMKPEVGINNFEVGVYTKASMMSFPPADDIVIEIEPEMPSMGHGSPNNVNPTSTGAGHYLGKVNFTMSGMWHVNLNVMDKDANVHVSDQYFQIEF